MGPPRRICFVCTGNICRSPSAEVVTRSRLAAAGLADRVAVQSAGTGGWHVGDPMDPRSARALAARGYPTEHRARQFDADWFDRFDLVVALDRGHLRELRHLARDDSDRAKLALLGEFDPAVREHGAAPRDVADPYYGGPRGFEDVLDQLESACAGLVASLGAG